jgi:shikimate kinase
MNIVLCGPPFSGKTYIGKLLAERLNYTFYDTDRLIESVYHVETGYIKTCRSIHQQEGEKRFRELEKKAILQLSNIESSVVALGGGSLLDPTNVDHLKKMGRLIYLKTSPLILLKRLRDKVELPSYLQQSPDVEKTFLEITEKRSLVCKKYADFELNVDEVVCMERIVKLLEL